MKASEYFPHGVPKIKPPEEFFEAHVRLREADYRGPWLRETGLKCIEKYATDQGHHKTKSTTDEIYYLWALCLQAEIYDYYGEYDEARGVLEIEGARLLQDMKNKILGAQHEGLPSRPLLRQQLWALILWAHCHYRRYRMPDLETAQQMLVDIRKQIEHYFPLGAGTKQEEPSFGLRARVCYSLGQVARQMSDLGAREEFISAICFTRKRLLAKTEKASDFLDREQKYANYIIAKAFSFGLAWASYQCGELQRALGAAAAGSALLRTTNDDVHASFAQVMYAQILSDTADVTSADGLERIAEAIGVLEPLADQERSPLKTIPKFLGRAQYTLARVYFIAGRHKEAEKLTRDVSGAQKSGSRWHIECATLLVRLLLAQEKFKEACEQSNVLMELKENGTDGQRMEALLCRAEVLMQSGSKSYGEIVTALQQAETLAQGNPLATAVCSLQRVRYYIVIGNKDLAREEMSKWDIRKHAIEHHYVFRLAEDVKRQLSAADHRLIILPEDLAPAIHDGSFRRGDKNGQKDRKTRKKKVGAYGIVDRKAKEWLIRQLYARYGDRYLLDENPDRFLGVTKTAVEDWQRKIKFNPMKEKAGQGSSSGNGFK
jgi:tetratricopeptide (TPR) repeat protein